MGKTAGGCCVVPWNSISLTSVSKRVQGKDKIAVQGDLVDEIMEFLVELYKVPEGQIALRFRTRRA